MSGWHARCLAAAGVALLASACGEPAASPEARIKSLVEQAEQGAEARDISVLGDLVSADYGDGRGYDRRAVLRIAQGLFLRNREIHLLSLVKDLKVNGDTAVARVLVAMAGRPIESVQALVELRADLVRFEIEIAREDGDWRVRSADWRRAEVSDFL